LLHEEHEHDDCISDPSGSGWDVLEAWGQRGVVLVLKLNEKGQRDFEESDVGDGWSFNLSALAPSRVTQLEGWVARVLANVPRDDTLVAQSSHGAGVRACERRRASPRREHRGGSQPCGAGAAAPRRSSSRCSARCQGRSA
jgi:hypothetical protein